MLPFKLMKRWTVITILAVAQFIMILDSTVMNVSISTVAKDLDTTISGMQVAITFYTLTMAALMLSGGKIGDILGRLSTFKIGSVIYGIGSLITGLSVSLGMLLVGWSFIEGLGAVLVIPAIAALAATNYKGKARIMAFSILGAVTGLAAAAGPLIGGLMTTYFSWRYVFIGETVVMAVVLFLTHKIPESKVTRKATFDLESAVLSASGLGLFVFGILQSKTWGWVVPKNSPEVAGHAIEPFGISIVSYLILAGMLILWMFIKRQQKLVAEGKDPLLPPALLKIPVLRSGLGVLAGQYFAVAGIFFVIPVYLQTILGYDALKTGLKILPLSLGLVVFSVIGSRLSSRKTPRYIVRLGQIILVAGCVLIFTSVGPDLKSWFFALGMIIMGAGFGLLASQIGNVNMSAVDQKETNTVGGLQGTFQNLGSSLGTALVGSIFIIALSSGFVKSIQNSPDLSAQSKDQILADTSGSLQIVSAEQATTYLEQQGLDSATAAQTVEVYQESQIQGLKVSIFLVALIELLFLIVSRNIPDPAPVKVAGSRV